MTEPTRTSRTIEFLEYHQPLLRDGEYRIEVTQRLSHAEKISTEKTFTTAEKSFRVIGERFALNPGDIETLFPPENSGGDHSMVLPHVVLNRSTLPWERFAEEGDFKTPWLALLVFQEEDALRVEAKVVEFKELLETDGPRFPTLKREQELDGDKVSVIDVPWELLQSILPLAAELRLQAHVRQTKDKEGKLEGPELAVLVANRLPEAGKLTTAYLVSLEGCFKQGAFHAAEAQPKELVRLVALKSWRFFCQDNKVGFTDMIRGLNLDPPYLRRPVRPGEGDPILDLGGVPLPHQLRDGGRTVSIYRGPLIAFAPDKESPDQTRLPAAVADELLNYDPSTGLFETGYAAAWELGRLLTLRRGHVATALYQWKRTHAGQLNRAEQVLAHPHLPGHQEPRPEAAELRLPDVVEAWFDDLRALKGVPFNYLVPDEEMLPPESLRFFWLDPFWMGALLDGAFSIGRVTSRDHDADRNFPLQDLWKSRGTGVLLRSAAVAAWPDLQIDGYGPIFADKGEHPDDILPRPRLERLGVDVMLCLFDGEAQTIDLHQRPETLHFGLTPAEDGYVKKLRSATGDESDAAGLRVPWRAGAATRVLDVGTFAGNIAKALPADPAAPNSTQLTSAQFALEMIEGVQKVRFTMG